MARKKPGPDPILTEDVFKKIRQATLEGKNLQETANACELNRDSFYVWHSANYLNLADKIEGWKRDRKVMLAHGNLEEFLTMKAEDPATLRVKADMTKFTLETLDKDVFSKRTELTGKDGEQLGVVVLPQRNENTLATDNQTEGSTSQD